MREVLDAIGLYAKVVAVEEGHDQQCPPRNIGVEAPRIVAVAIQCQGRLGNALPDFLVQVAEGLRCKALHDSAREPSQGFERGHEGRHVEFIKLGIGVGPDAATPRALARRCGSPYR